MNVPYIGNGTYCFANSATMLLAAAGLDLSASTVEALTTVGIGATFIPMGEKPLLFFSGELPDLGVSLALRTLGYEFEHLYTTPEADPDGRDSFARLRALLQYGPVAVGPLDMGLLLYNPAHQHASGADHFVVIYDATEEMVSLHDPAGYPYVTMAVEDFLPAWRGEGLGYGQGAYSMWGKLRRVYEPSHEEMFEATDARLRERLGQGQAKGGLVQGAEAIRRVVGMVGDDGMPEHLHGHLVWFALPLGARRADDFARFFAPYDAERAAVKAQQARLFGAAHSALMRNEFAKLREALEAIAVCEEQFTALTLAVPTPA